MSQVNATIAGRQFRLACEDGQEEHLQTLASDIDRRIVDLRAKFGEIGDTRLTVMAALTVADELAETLRKLRRMEEEIAALQDARVVSSDRAKAASDAVVGRLQLGRRAPGRHHQQAQRHARQRRGHWVNVSYLSPRRGRGRRSAMALAPYNALHCPRGAARRDGANSPGPYDPIGSCPWPGSWARSYGAHLLYVGSRDHAPTAIAAPHFFLPYGLALQSSCAAQALCSGRRSRTRVPGMTG